MLKQLIFKEEFTLELVLNQLVFFLVLGIIDLERERKKYGKLTMGESKIAKGIFGIKIVLFITGALLFGFISPIAINVLVDNRIESNAIGLGVSVVRVYIVKFRMKKGIDSAALAVALVNLFIIISIFIMDSLLF